MDIKKEGVVPGGFSKLLLDTLQGSPEPQIKAINWLNTPLETIEAQCQALGIVTENAKLKRVAQDKELVLAEDTALFFYQLQRLIIDDRTREEHSRDKEWAIKKWFEYIDFLIRTNELDALRLRNLLLEQLAFARRASELSIAMNSAITIAMINFSIKTEAKKISDNLRNGTKYTDIPKEQREKIADKLDHLVKNVETLSGKECKEILDEVGEMHKSEELSEDLGWLHKMCDEKVYIENAAAHKTAPEVLPKLSKDKDEITQDGSPEPERENNESDAENKSQVEKDLTNKLITNNDNVTSIFFSADSASAVNNLNAEIPNSKTAPHDGDRTKTNETIVPNPQLAQNPSSFFSSAPKTQSTDATPSRRRARAKSFDDSEPEPPTKKF